MKKILSIVLALTMVFAMTACGSKAEETTEVPVQEMPASALEVLETVWADYTDDEKFAVIGGSMAAPVDGAPGSYDLADENITYSLLIPAEQLGNVTEAASMIHMMNANTFTCGAYSLKSGEDADAFVSALRDNIQARQWMCGFPEKLVIVTVDNVVISMFGNGQIVDTFSAKLGGTVVVDEAIL